MNPRFTAPPESDMLRCQEDIGYLFRREGLLRKALTHSSVKDDKHPSNERLEFLGDAILGMVISEYLFSMLPHNDEGDLTKVKSVVVSSQSLSRLGLELGLDKYLLIGKGIRLKKEIPRSLIANVVEAVIAAVYLDRGMEAARHFVLDHLHAYVEEVLADEHVEKNYKSLLQQCAQKELSGTPVYRVVGERGPDHSKSFRVAAVVNGREFPIGTGASKKEAEQEAAKIALLAIEKGSGRPKRKPRRETNGNGRATSRRKKDRPRTEERKEDEPRRRKSESRKSESRKSESRKSESRKSESRKSESRKSESRKKPEPRKSEERRKPESRKKATPRRKPAA
ncbi:MAG: ribonuclease III, partial [Planctomycetota bacterium]